MADALTEILRAASRHPNSRVSKLIHTVEAEPSQKNIVLLLIELAEHAEYSTDFNVSLKYYLELFEHLGIDHDLVLNEAGLLLVNSSKIYSKRVDYVQSLVERQILTLSNADDEIQKQKLEQQQQAETATPAEKPKRGRKRVLEAPTDPYEVELAPKKFKRLTEEKRFAQPKTPSKPKSLLRNIEMEQQIHPAGWLHATIYDLENEEDVDTKRNYKLFTYHVEHRYNTLVPDINFRLHFKVKDYIDEQEEMDEQDEACNRDRSWPPLSEAYVEKYLRLENLVLQQDVKASKRKAAEMDESSQDVEGSCKKLNDTAEGENIADLNQSQLNSSTGIDNDPANKSQENLDASKLNEKNDSGLGQSILDESNNTLENTQLNSTNLDDTTTAEGNKTLDESTSAQQEQDSGLGSSLLDQTSESGNNTTTETSVSEQTTETGNNTTADTTENLDTTNSDGSNETTTGAANQSLNTTQQENDSALGTSVLNQTGNIEANTTRDSGSVDKTNSESLNETNSTEASKPEKTAGDFDSTNTNEATETEADKSLNTTEILAEKETSPSTTENTETNGNKPTIDQTNESSPSTKENTESNGNEPTIDKTNEILETTTKESVVIDTNQEPEGLIKATDTRKDSALSDDHLYRNSISTENLAMSTENLNQIDNLTGKTFNIDVAQQDKDVHQITLHLPQGDDEGVCLSDLEDHDCRLLSPIIKATNILPGVERKDITIIMDDELRRALEMRDGIMQHFSHDIYKVPVIIEPKRENLIFNIFKFPEKLVRRKFLFKLGPEMDLYLQARSLKRSRPEPVTRVTRLTPQLLQWFSLNNTDMTGVCMTPPPSPGHCSEFCGFSDNGDFDDTISCAEFCGFTEEEQSSIRQQHVSRLSRDSGVGVDVNQLTPEKEPMEIIFEEPETSPADICKRNLNLDNENREQSAEELLKDLPADIRDALTTELEGSAEVTKEPNTESCSHSVEPSALNSLETKESSESVKSQEGLETEEVQTESSLKNSEAISSENTSANNTQESEIQPSENLSEKPSGSEESASNTEEPLSTTERLSEAPASSEESAPNTEEPLSNTKCLSEAPASSEESAPNTEEPSSVTESQSIAQGDKATESENPNGSTDEMKISCDKPVNSEQSKSAEELLKEKLDLANSMEEDDCLEDHRDADDSDDDDEMLDLDTQGVKTKIQQWHEHLQPILAKSRERHHFDVFKLGTEIIETVQNPTKPNDETTKDSNSSTTSPAKQTSATFHDIMDNKDQSYVSRYFLSTLLLANQSNIEISIGNKSSEKPSSWHDIHLKLLSTKRHTVAIEDNIGMIDKKVKQEQDKNKKPSSKEKLDKIKINQISQTHNDEDDDEPLIKLQGGSSIKLTPKKSKTSLKRTNDNALSLTPIAEKKSKETTPPWTTTTTAIISNQLNERPNLIQSVQIIKSPAMDITMLPRTSQQAQQQPQHFSTPLTSNVNIKSIRTLQPIEKVHDRSDDYDSGIFSLGGLSTS